jgi:Putative auto-transporter adhesin, head GIN domain
MFEYKTRNKFIYYNCNFTKAGTFYKKNNNMKRIILGLFFLINMLGLYAQTDKNLVFDANAEPRSVKDFTGIEVSGAISVYLSQGTEDALAISASSQEIVKKIKTEVRNGILHIYFDEKGFNWNGWGNTKMKAYITFKQLNHIESSGACNVKVIGIFKADNLVVSLSGASDFTGDLAIEKLDLNVSGATKSTLSGKVNQLMLGVSGASSVRAYDLVSNMATIGASGASSVHVSVDSLLSATASGSSSITYKGAAELKKMIKTGVSSIKKIQ